MKYQPLDSIVFRHHRNEFSKKMLPGSLAIFVTNAAMPRSADSYHTFRPNPDLYHLTGIDQEETALVLFPDAPNPAWKEVLFIRQPNEHLRIWEGEKLSKSEASALSGIETVHYISSLENILHPMMGKASACYLNTNENDRADLSVPDYEMIFARKWRDRYPVHSFLRSAPMMHQLRAIKHPLEVEAIRKACQITRSAFERVLHFVKPGVMEYEIEAEITHEMLRLGADGHAYTPIVASGKDSCVLHYIKNHKRCDSGDLVLMDFGAAYAHYASDLSRTIPVDGRFTDRQKSVYNAVLRVMMEAKQMLRPGNTLTQYHQEVGKIMESELIGLGLLDRHEVAKQSPDQPLYKKYFMHGTSHFLGIDVHDVGDRYAPFAAGMVFTCEPGIYIPEESIGIRLENDILITDTDPVDLMADIPIEAEEIESLMHARPNIL